LNLYPPRIFTLEFMLWRSFRRNPGVTNAILFPYDYPNL
jgi:hypothetical protein